MTDITPEDNARMEANKKPMTPTEAEAMIQTAREYIDAGLSVVPLIVDGKGWIKEPALYKDVIQDIRRELITPERFDELTRTERAKAWRGLAVVCGHGSGGFECIDVDLKHDPTGKIVEDYLELVKSAEPKLYARLVIAETPTGGVHIYYRRDLSQADWKERQGGLAFAVNENGTKGPALIENRILDKGYVVVPPTDGRKYRQGDFRSIPQITEQERATLFGMARELSRYIEPEREERPASRQMDTISGERPGDEYNSAVNIRDLLEPEGWKTWEGPGGRTFVLRPGASSATSGNIKDGKLWLWTTGAGLPNEKTLSPFAVYTHLRHGGDWSKAAKELYRVGYGRHQTIRMTRATIRTEKPDGSFEVIAAPGDAVSVADIHAMDAMIHRIEYPPGTDPSELFNAIAGLDAPGGPPIMLQQVNRETGEVGPEYLSPTWIVAEVIGPHEKKAQAGEEVSERDRGQIQASIAGYVRTTKNAVARSQLRAEATRWTHWEALGITADALAEMLYLAEKEAAQREWTHRRTQATEALAEAQRSGDEKAYGEALKRLNKLTSGGGIDPVRLMAVPDVKVRITDRQPGLSTGWDKLDNAGIRLRPGSMVVIGARTNNGKTAFMVNMAVRAAANNPERVFYYLGYEENDVDLYDKLIPLVSGKSWTEQQIRDAIADSSKAHADLRDAIEAVDALVDDTTGRIRIINSRPSLEEVGDYLEGEKRRGVNVSGLFIDYAQIAKVRGRFDGIRERIIHVTQVVSDIALDLDIPVVIAAQLNREAAGEIPQTSHFKESGSIEEKAALCLLLWAIEFDQVNTKDNASQGKQVSQSALKVYASKTRRFGKGDTTLQFDGPTQQIVDTGSPVSMTGRFADLVAKRKPQQTKMDL
jgi:hypothetical protein